MEYLNQRIKIVMEDFFTNMKFALIPREKRSGKDPEHHLNKIVHLNCA